MGIAKNVITVLNTQDQDVKRRSLESRDAELYARGNVDKRYRDWLREMAARDAVRVESRALSKPVPETVGYVTKDVSTPPHSICKW